MPSSTALVIAASSPQAFGRTSMSSTSTGCASGARSFDSTCRPARAGSCSRPRATQRPSSAASSLDAMTRTRASDPEVLSAPPETPTGSGCLASARILDVPSMQSPNRADAVLELVDSIPKGRVMTYGDVAHHLGIPSARIVGQVLAARGDSVAWHRVVLSTGSAAAHLAARQLSLLE